MKHHHAHGHHDHAHAAHAHGHEHSVRAEPEEASCCGAHSSASATPTADASHGASTSAATIDPVCGMTVKADSPHVLEHEGATYRFCSAGCRAKFSANPHRYLHGKQPAGDAAHPPSKLAKGEPPAPEGTIYTCPMHPEIRQVGPGSCPICGMALEPLMPTAEEDDSELRAVRRRFWVSLALTIPVVLIAMLPHALGLSLAHQDATGLR